MTPAEQGQCCGTCKFFSFSKCCWMPQASPSKIEEVLFDMEFDMDKNDGADCPVYEVKP